MIIRNLLIKVIKRAAQGFLNYQSMWKDNSLVLECETEEDRDKAKDILNKGEVIIKVKPKDEGQKKTK